MEWRWFKVTLRVREGAQEALWLWLAEMGTQGVWEVDRETLIAYFSEPLSSVPQEFAASWWQEEERNEPWETKWKESFTPLRVGENVVVRPPWEGESGAPLEIVIYPAYAFGTGQHPTTYGCLLFLDRYFQRGWSLFDVGTGSGILAIFAVKKGAGRVCAIDIDPSAIEEVHRNMSLNGIESSWIECLVGEISTVSGPFDCVVANVGPAFHLEHLGGMKALTREGGFVILSGFEEADFPPIKKKMMEIGLILVDSYSLSSWMTVVCEV